MNNTMERNALDAIISAIVHSAKSIDYEPRDDSVADAQIVKDLSEAYLNLIKSGNERGFNNG